MGGGGSSLRKSPVGSSSSYNMSRPGSPKMPSQKQLRQYQMQQNSGYGGPPVMNPSPIPYGDAYNSGQYPGYRPPSPFLRRLSGQFPNAYPQQSPFGPGGYRDSDYAAVANISGLNPADVALLHREYSNLTRGGINKIDRVVFRQLLRDALIDANNENVDRAIENIFIAIDRNRDGFIDFPEFVGAFRDVLKSGTPDPFNFIAQPGICDLINEQPRINSPYVCQPIALPQQPQVISVPCPSTQQSSLAYNCASPVVLSLDSNQSPYICNTQGQYVMTQPSILQCTP